MHHFLLALATAIIFLQPMPALAQDAPVLEPDPATNGDLPADEFFKARVLAVLDEGVETFDDGTILPHQRLRAEVTSGALAGEIIEFDHGTQFSITESQLLDAGDEFILGKSYKVDGSSYFFMADHYRLNMLIAMGIFFILLVALVAGRRGVLSFAGLALSLAVLAGFIVPRILAGSNPIAITLIGATVIILTSLYVAHGFSIRTTLALAGTLITLLVATGAAMLAVHITQLSGLGSEAAYVLQFSQAASLDMRGLLLAGILIGTLGVLDDVTTAQVAAVAELRSANHRLGSRELFERALNIGREHILALVNTLVLAYAGASLPVFLFLSLNRQYPLWMTLNGEFLTEEIIRTLIGSSALILAVPITTALAAAVLSRRAIAPSPNFGPHAH